MNIMLWLLQVLLATAFFAHGVLYLFPPAEMIAQMNAVVPPALRLFIGAAEIAAAFGLILPGVTRIQPQLVAYAAAGVAFVAASACVLHLSRGETAPATVTALLFAMSAFVAYMRGTVLPIAPRTPA